LIEWRDPKRHLSPTIADAKELSRSIRAQRHASHVDIADGFNTWLPFEVLSWIERLDPNASVALRLAALFCDIDDPVVPETTPQDRRGVQSSQWITPVLSELGFTDLVVERTGFLIAHHDDSAENVERIADTELFQLIAARSLSSISQFPPTEGTDRLHRAVRAMVDKLPEPARTELWEHRLPAPQTDKLKSDVLREYYREHSPRERPYKYCPTCRTVLQRKTTDGTSLLTCLACGFILWNPPVPVTSVIIEKGSSVLLLKRAARPLRDYWCLPGGFIRYLETPEMAAIREVKEETGLDVEINQLAGIYQIDNAPGGVSLDIIWKASVAGGLLQTNEESIEARYFEKATLPELIAYKHRQAIMEH